MLICPHCHGDALVASVTHQGPAVKRYNRCRECQRMFASYEFHAADLHAMLEGVQADPPFVLRSRGRPPNNKPNRLATARPQEPFNAAEHGYGNPPKPRVEQALCPHCADEGRVASPGHTRKTVKHGTNHWRYMQCSACDRHYHVATSWENGESIVHKHLPEGVRY